MQQRLFSSASNGSQKLAIVLWWRRGCVETSVWLWSTCCHE
jgi:hypothetical protein